MENTENKTLPNCLNCTFAGNLFDLGKEPHHYCQHPTVRGLIEDGELNPIDALMEASGSCELHQHDSHKHQYSFKEKARELTIPLGSDLFEMTKSGIAKESYVPLSFYWANRLLTMDYETDGLCWDDLIKKLSDHKHYRHESINSCLAFFGVSVREFTKNTIRIGFKKSKNQKIISLQHNGLEIRTGVECWGASPDVVYFVIKHGDVI